MEGNETTIKRNQTWGVISYDRLTHRFDYKANKYNMGEPYNDVPVVLNIVITRKCNMNCKYCVAKDFTGIEKEDLLLSNEMIEWINRSDFMLLVLTGGEPLMPPYDDLTIKLVESIKDRGIIIDTNGTFLPETRVLNKLKEKKVMVRVSLDSIRPKEEIIMRRALKQSGLDDKSAYYKKLENIKWFIAAGIYTSIQTVVWHKNIEPLFKMIDWLSENGIKRWYLQRLIPSHMVKKPSRRFAMKPEEYYRNVEEISAKASRNGIECIAKKDLRHNSVFLLTSNGALYTQGSAPGQKIKLGMINDEIKFFDYVSAADHACRYYLAELPHEEISKRPK